jgi:flavin-dependent dehydrogenase
MHEYDVVLIGGAFSGASTGLLLKRHWPKLRVLIVEPRLEFDRKVGESTSDVAGCFLTRVLRQHGWLVQHQIPKQGLRFWFNDEQNEDPARCSEMGSYFQVRLPTFQLDRQTLDEHLLAEAVAAGCELWRPAKVRHLHLGGANRVQIDREGTSHDVKARWVIDASGKAAVIARQRKTLADVPEHPTRSMWVRFRNVRDLDSYEAGMALGEGRDALFAARHTATNHLGGRGWWCWLIPLKNGDLSAGITWDTRYFTPPDGANIGERLKTHLCAHPVGRLMFEHAEPVEHDARAYNPVAYRNTEVIGDGWACIGDACGFMDPLYSHGLDFCAHTSFCVQNIVGRDCVGEDMTAELERYRIGYQRSYSRWFDSLYKDKYRYLGDAELMWAAFLMDLATYFLGPVASVYRDYKFEYTRMPYDHPVGVWVAKLMTVYNRRLGVLADKRLAAGCYGRKNLDQRMLVKRGFAPGPAAFPLFRQGLYAWLRAEWHGLWLRPQATSAPAAARPAPAPVAMASAEPA